MRIIESLEELKSLAGTEVAVSDWIVVDQERIDLFADATGDRQWIHVDAERARRDSPFGGTVAHGYLTLSLLPVLLEQSIALRQVRMALNYGVNKVRFPAPLPSGSRLRARFVPAAVADVEDGAQVIWQVTMEREGGDKPVCVAEAVVRCYW